MTTLEQTRAGQDQVAEKIATNYRRFVGVYELG